MPVINTTKVWVTHTLCTHKNIKYSAKLLKCFWYSRKSANMFHVSNVRVFPGYFGNCHQFWIGKNWRHISTHGISVSNIIHKTY